MKAGEGHGFDVVLRSIVDEIAEMETTGFQVQTEHGETFRVFGTLAQYTADSLAMNQILGLIESFSHDFFCVFCFTTREQMQNCFREENFQLRAYCDCEADLELLKGLAVNHVRGFCRFCPLNRLTYYKSTENWINDVMHSVLEGLIPLVLSCVLRSLYEENFITLPLLNGKINSVFASLRIEKKKKTSRAKFNSRKRPVTIANLVCSSIALFV